MRPGWRCCRRATLTSGRIWQDQRRQEDLADLLVRGSAVGGYALQIADGYHRVCASYLTDENTNIPCHLVSWQ